MIRSFAALILMVAPLSGLSGLAQAEDDDLVRLPGSGEVKSEANREKLNADRLKPGGGLLASFDVDGNGSISEAEMSAGVLLAFEAADENGDGELTALEQQAWAARLPTHDDSLANPVRFDPNLDRRVSLQEFSAVISDLGADYREGDAELRIASLKVTKRDKRRERREEILSNQIDDEYGLPGAAVERDF